MNWHEVIDRRSYDMDRVIARILREDPSKLELVSKQMDERLHDPNYSDSLKECVREWKEIVDQGLPRVMEALADFSEEGRRLRQNSPFAILMPKDERMKILRRYEALRNRTYPSSV